MSSGKVSDKEITDSMSCACIASLIEFLSSLVAVMTEPPLHDWIVRCHEKHGFVPGKTETGGGNINPGLFPDVPQVFTPRTSLLPEVANS